MAARANLDDRTNPSTAYVDRRMVAGSAALMTGGLLMCLAGATVGVVALVGAVRHYVADLEEPPREIARRRLRQVRSATAAGAGAWQNYGRQARPESVR
jgi:hypothetical protein